MNVVLYYKEGSGLLEHFQNNWNRRVEHERDEEGELIEVIKGIHPRVANVEFISTPISKGSESVKIYTSKNRQTPVFTLEGPKARQLKVLEDYVKGLLNAR